MEFLIGTYTQNTAAKQSLAEGIYSVKFDTNTGEFSQPTLRIACENPSWITLSPDRQMLFAVQESFLPNDAALVSYEIGPNHEYSENARVAINGDAPCHVSFDPHYSRIASAQYMGGNAAIANLKAQHIEHPIYLEGKGTGPNKLRQEAPHVHFVEFTDRGSVLHVTDLGTDQIRSYEFDADLNVIRSSILETLPGSGPRHLAIASDHKSAWAICELDETILKLSRAGIGWSIDTVVSAFSGPRTQNGAASAIRYSPDEKHIYVSGRHQNCIACFDTSGQRLFEEDSGGAFPRDFLITSDGQWVITTNQNNNTIASLKRNPETGKLSPARQFCSVETPVAIIEF